MQFIYNNKQISFNGNTIYIIYIIILKFLILDYMIVMFVYLKENKKFKKI